VSNLKDRLACAHNNLLSKSNKNTDSLLDNTSKTSSSIYDPWDVDSRLSTLTRELEITKEDLINAKSELTKAKKDVSAANLRAANAISEVERLRQELVFAKNQAAAPMLDKHMIKRLKQLCHPDKHDGKQSAHEVLQWLNGLG